MEIMKCTYVDYVCLYVCVYVFMFYVRTIHLAFCVEPWTASRRRRRRKPYLFTDIYRMNAVDDAA